MTKLSLLEILQPQSCPFCHSNLFIRMCWYNSSLKQNFSIKDNVFKYNNVCIDLNSQMYWLGDDQTKSYAPDEEVRHSDSYHFIKECYKCDHRYCNYTSELIFERGFIRNLSLEKISFQVTASDNETLIVTQDGYTNKTKVVFSKLKEFYSGILLPDNTYLELPMIKFNFDEPNSIVNRIKTFTILS
jgi:hypothetical protein